MRELTIQQSRLELLHGNIVDQDTEAIVNAANSGLRGGGGVDGAIHAAGGPQILSECIALNGCATGDAKLTGGGRLAARYVIHAVGPIYRGGQRGEAELLASAYRRSLEVAAERRIRSVAFPSISTGAYAYPVPAAANIALSTVIEFLQQQGARLQSESTTAPLFIELVRFVLFSRADLSIYEQVLAKLAPSAGTTV